MRLAVGHHHRGVREIVRALPDAIAHRRGERVIEGTFIGHARVEGNASATTGSPRPATHATTLHWTDNDGQVREGELVLVDAGVEVDSLYTADITRTLPSTARSPKSSAASTRQCSTRPTRVSPPPCRAPGSGTSTRRP